VIATGDCADENSPFMQKTDQELRGIGGWLILLAFVVIALPGNLLRHSEQAARLFRSPSAQPFLTSGSPYFDAHWQALALIETAGFGCAFVPAVALIPLFFFKHRYFPTAFSMFGCYLAALAAAQLYCALIIPTMSLEFRGAVVTTSIASMAGVSIWIAYVFRSRRVRLTFTRSVYPSPSFPYFQCMYP
jgi:hypothetical protein